MTDQSTEPQQATIAPEEIYQTLMQNTAQLLNDIGSQARNGTVTGRGIHAMCMFGWADIQLLISGKVGTTEGQDLRKVTEALVADPNNDELWQMFHDTLQRI